MSVSSLLASVSNAVPAEPETDAPEGESEETESSEESASEDLAEHAAEGEETEESEESEETEEAADDEKADRMRQADYTRKTQALAEERKQIQAELAAEKKKYSDREEDVQEVQDWLQSLHNVEDAEYQLARFFPQTVEALKNKWIAEAGEESQLTERERAMRARVRQLEIEKRGREEDEKKLKTQAQKQQTMELRAKFDSWLPGSAKAAGLVPDEDTFRLIRNELMSGAYDKVQWSENVFAAAAKAVAKAIKRGEPPPAEAAKKAAPPSLKGTGQKAPPGAKAAAAAKPKKSPQKSEDFFKQLREKYR